MIHLFIPYDNYLVKYPEDLYTPDEGFYELYLDERVCLRDDYRRLLTLARGCYSPRKVSGNVPVVKL